MRGKKRPNDQRMAAVALAEVRGVEVAAEATGIPERTIYYWLDRPEFAELRAKTREEMRDGFRVLVHKAQERLTALIDTMEPRDLTILLGVSTEKALLVGGEATSRTEHLTDGLSDDEKRRLRDAITEAARAEASIGRDGDGMALPSETGAAATG